MRKKRELTFAEEYHLATLAEIAEKPSGTVDEIRAKIEIQTQLARIRIRLNNGIS